VTYRSPALTISKIGIVGSGQIGPDIALYFAKALHPYGVTVEVVDIAPEALERGRSKLAQKVAKGRETGAFKPAAAEAIVNAVTFSADYDRLAGADLVIEAATEDVAIKRRIFAQLERLCPPDAVLASNSSHLPPEEIFADLAHPERSLVIHYFFPAERNPLVEIVPGEMTRPAIAQHLMAFYEALGKVPILVRSRYGYAVDPVFEGLFLAAALAVEAGLGTTKEVDWAARRALGLGVGPFTAINLTGGNPITDHGLDEMQRRFGGWFRSPRLMKEAIAAGRPWEVPGRGEKIELSAEAERRIAEWMQGAYFGLAGQVVDTGIVSLSDLEMAVELGLVMRPPFGFMNRLGPARALELVEAFAAANPGFAVPACLREQARSGRPFPISHVLRRDEGDVAVLTIRRPRVLNALDEAVYRELTEHFTAIRDDPAIVAVVLTGFGTKAFVSGADVNFLAKIETPEEGTATSERSKVPGRLIEQLGKPVICALNGSAIGGGNELAMCCTARIARKGLAVAASQPEALLGIVPGAGATQRLPRLIGVERSAALLRPGRPLSGPDAVACGLVRAEVEGDLVTEAVDLARKAAAGKVALQPIDPGPLQVPTSLSTVDLGHLSRATDALISRAVLEGCRMPLTEGLHFESEMFGACCATEDMRIGVANFIEHGPRAPAAFVHR